MFSTKEKQHIAKVIEETILALNHPEMPKERPSFKIHIDGKESWSWADIEPNWRHDGEAPATSHWNENAREYMNKN